MSRKRTRYERIALVERPADEEDESSEEEEDPDEGSSDSGEADDDTSNRPVDQQANQPTAKRGKLSVALNKTSELVCHVCGGKGHKAGFVGATYFDCPNKPCYLCKGVGHTTATCPHRAAIGTSTAAAAAAGKNAGSTSQLLMQREQAGRQRRGPLVPPRSHPWQVEAAILKLHTRRVCCLEFPDSSSSSGSSSGSSSSSHVISGDKKGGIAIWNFMQVHDRTIYSNIHWALVNTICWSPWITGGYNCSSSSSDGTAKIFDIETGSYQTLLDLNPDGWHQGCKWKMFYASGSNKELKVVLAGDNDGKVHLLDPRVGSSGSSSNGASVSCLQLHKGGSKVNAVSVNPVGGAHVVLTAGSDHTVKLFDLRKLGSVRSSTAAGSSSSSPPAAPQTPPAAAAAGSSSGAASEPVVAGQADGAAAAGSSRGRGRGRGAGRGRGKKTAAAAAAGDDNSDDDDHNQDHDDDLAAAGGSGRGRGRGRGRGSSATAAAASSSSTTTAKANRAAMAAAMAAAKAAELAVMQHSRVVNHAVFSPSGQKILTTCQDNRLRIWDNLLTCQGPPAVEIVHSHDFNRYLTPFKAEWFPNDPSDSRIICGRYISENFGGVALHPVDIYDATNGRLLQQLIDLNLNTITPVNKPHPRLDIIISGSSRSLYKWVPQLDEDEEAPLSVEAADAAADLVRQATAAAAAARSSSSFMCVDADANGSGSGKRKKSGAGSSSGTGTKSLTKTKRVSQETAAGNSRRGRGRGRTAPAGGRGSKRGRGPATAAAGSDDDEEEADNDDGDSDDE